tara:strand:- start:6525 stop:6965 length:441 start_codon:yes stop_codon:yes gene_type:complete
MLHLPCKLKLYKAHYQYNSSVVPKIAAPLLLSASYITKNHYVHNISDIVCYTISFLNYSSFYIDDHLKKIDEWRNNEAEYEEKTDPPIWSLKIKDENQYILKHFSLGTSFLSNIFYILFFFQIIIFVFSNEKILSLFDFIPDLFII